MTSAGAARHLRPRPQIVDGVGDKVEAEFAKDCWDADVLGIPTRRGANIAQFSAIQQLWLREAVKEWSRFRLGAGYSYSTAAAGGQNMARFSIFLATRRPEVIDHTGLTREVIEHFLLWMTTTKWSVNTRSVTLTFVKVFLDWGRRHDTLPGLPVNAVIYEEEVSRPADRLPQFVPEFVMAQLESETNLAQIHSPSLRHLIIVLVETGIRGGDATSLVFNPIIADSTGWPCLRFDNAKVGVEQLVPLSAKAADTIRAQQDYVRSVWPNGTPWLFPGILDNDDGAKQYAHASLSGQLGRWQQTGACQPF